MLRWHRLSAIVGAVLVLWIVLTGTGIQIADMRALLSHAPACDPDMQKMAQWHTGPTNFVVRQCPDFTARPLPAGIDAVALLQKTAALGRAAAPGAAMKAVELRMVGPTLAGYVQMDDARLIFDMASGARLPDSALPLKPITTDFSSPRQTFKKLHRFAFWGPWALTLNLLAGMFLSALCVTGFMHFWKLWQLRRKKGKGSPFWQGGTRWRRLHRWISVATAVPVIWLVGVGMVLSFNNVGQLINTQSKIGTTAKKAETADLSAPIADADIPAFANASLAAFHRDHPGIAPKTLRLRYFSGYAQGVIIAADDATSQLVYNARTGAAMSETEPGYPDTFYPLGWEGNQVLKRLHRGDSAGMLGRWLILIGALALCYQAISGVVIYLSDRSAKRRRMRAAAAASAPVMTKEPA